MKIELLLLEVKAAAKALRSSSARDRNGTLLCLAKKLISNMNSILDANRGDLEALGSDASPAFVDRLIVTESRIQAMVASLKQVASLPDPLGEVVQEHRLPNGLLTKKVRSPLGVIFMIFESRPNVAIEAFSLALKSGNAIILRGGKESMKTTKVFFELMKESLEENKLPTGCALGIIDSDRRIVMELLQANQSIDVVVPRGGKKLIEFVVANSKIPIIKNDRGLCHIFVDESAETKMVLSIVQNGKVQRPGVCNSIETLLIHKSRATEILPLLFNLISTGSTPVTWHVCEESSRILPESHLIKRATQINFDTEYLDLELNCKIVSSLGEALDHIDTHGSKHSESIITSNESNARQFQNEIDAAAVYWNASTRFTDGFQLGLGGELGISTQKLHVRGPVGLKELTSVRWIMDGTGQIRE